MERENTAPYDPNDSSNYVSSPNRRKSTSFLAVKEAVYQLTCLNDFTCEKLGAGFFADVYKVRHKTTGEVMVLKMNRSSNSKKQMLAEIQLLNRLSHPNILGFKGSCVHEGQLHALTEYMNGGTLEDIIQDESITLSWSTRIKMAMDVAKGMAYLHCKGVFHRDLTSKNCLLQRLPDDGIKTVVADFGLAAKIKHKQKRRSYTETVGSAYWMAPECLRGKEYCEKADVFSYGIILAELMSRLSADPDYMPRTNDFGVDFKKLYSLVDDDVPSVLWDLLLQCTNLDPNTRPTFNEIVDKLSTIVISDEAKPTGDTTKRTLVTSQSEPILFLTDVKEEDELIEELKAEETDGSYEFTPQQTPITPLQSDLEATLSSLLDGTHISAEEESKILTTPVPKRNDFLIQEGLSLLSDGEHETVGGDSGIDPGYYMRSISQRSNGELNSDSKSSSSTSLRLERFNSPYSSTGNHCRETSDSSEISFHLPSPSYAWAPPSSPVPQQRKTNSFSFPSSPMSPKKLYSIPDSTSPSQLNDDDLSPTNDVGVVGQLFDTQSPYVFGCKKSQSMLHHPNSSISTPNLQSV